MENSHRPTAHPSPRDEFNGTGLCQRGPAQDVAGRGFAGSRKLDRRE